MARLLPSRLLLMLGKMKPLVADKLVVSLLGGLNEMLTTLSSSVLGNLHGEGRQIDDCKGTHWYQRLPTLPENQLQNLYPSNKTF